MYLAKVYVNFRLQLCVYIYICSLCPSLSHLRENIRLLGSDDRHRDGHGRPGDYKQEVKE